MPLIEVTDPAELAIARREVEGNSGGLVEVTDPAELKIAQAAFASKITTEDGRFRIIDGDTAEDLSTGQHLRLSGINTTEAGRNTHDQAALELKRQLDSSPGATYKIIATDPYKRAVVEFVDKDGGSINRRMVESGFAGSLNMGGQPGAYNDAAIARNLRAAGIGTVAPEIQAAEARYNEAMRTANPADVSAFKPSKPKLTLKQELGEGVQRGTDQLQGALYGAIDALGTVAGSDAVSKVGREGYLKNEKEAAEHPATVKGIEHIKNVGDFAHWAFGAGGEVLPSVGVGIATGGAGALAARSLTAASALTAARTQAIEKLVGKGVPFALAERAIERGLSSRVVGQAMAQAMNKATTVGAGAGLWAGSAAQEGGGSFEEMKDAGISAPGTAAVVGLVGGGLDALPALRIFSRVFPGVDKEVAKNFTARVVKALGFDQAILEGSTEAAQELVAIAGRAYNDPNFKVDSAENRMRVINAAAAGALVGTVGGAGSAFISRDQPSTNVPPPSTNVPPPPSTNAAATNVSTNAAATNVSTNAATVPSTAAAAPSVDPADTTGGRFQRTVMLGGGQSTRAYYVGGIKISPEQAAALIEAGHKPEDTVRVTGPSPDNAPKVAPSNVSTNAPSIDTFTQPGAAVDTTPVSDPEVPPIGAEVRPNAPVAKPVPGVAAPVAAPVVPDAPVAPVQQELTLEQTLHKVLDDREALAKKLATKFKVSQSKAAAPEVTESLRSEVIDTPTAVPQIDADEHADQTATPEAAAELDVRDVGVVYHGKGDTVHFSSDGAKIEVAPYARALGSARKRLKALIKEAKSEGTDSTFSMTRVPGGFAIEEKLAPDAQRFSYEGKAMTKPLYVARMASKAKQLAADNNRDRGNADNAKRHVLLRDEEGKLKKYDTRTITRIGLSLDTADGNKHAKGPDRIRSGFARGLSALAGMPSPLTVETTTTTQPVKFGEGTRVATSEETNLEGRVVHTTAGGKDWTLADLRKAQRSPAAKRADLSETLKKAEAALAKIPSRALEKRKRQQDFIDSVINTLAGLDLAIEREEIAGVEGASIETDYLEDGTETQRLNEYGTGESTALDDESDVRQLSDDSNLDDPIKSEEKAAAEDKHQNLGREATDKQTQGKAIRSAKSIRDQAQRTAVTTRGDRRVGASVTADELAMLRDLADHVQLGTTIRLLDEDGMTDSEGDQQTLADAKNGLKGRVWYEGQTLRIFISKRVKGKADRVRVLAHELGHGVAAALFHTLPSTHPARQRLIDAHAKDLTDPASTANQNFDEWLANQFVAWAIRNQEPKNIIEAFFQKVARAVKAMVTRLKKAYQLDEEYRDVLDGMIEDLKTKGIRKMWVGEGRDDWHAPSFVSNSRLAAQAARVLRPGTDVVKHVALEWIAPVQTWLRNQNDEAGNPIKEATILANIWNRIPGDKIADDMAAKDHLGNPIRQGLLEDRQAHMGVFMTQAQRIDEMLTAWSPKVTGTKRLSPTAHAERKAANEAANARALDDLYAGRATPVTTAVRKLLADMHTYLKLNIPELGHIADYIPRVYDVQALQESAQEFIALLVRHGVDANDAADIHAKLSDDSGYSVALSPLERNPAFAAGKQRGLDAIPDSELAPFLTKDLGSMLLGYIKSGVKRAESDRRFGRYELDKHGKRKKDEHGNDIWNPTKAFDELLHAAEARMTLPQAARLRTNMAALRGELGANFDPKIRHLMSYAMVYQNYRVLPFSLLSQFPDLGGIVVGSRGFRSAWHGMVEGFRSTIVAAKGGRDVLHELAEFMGIISEAVDMESLNEATSSNFVTRDAKRANDLLFKYNLMQAFTRMTRVMALSAGRHFIKTEAAKAPNARSTRYLEELGLTRDEVNSWVAAEEPVWGKDRPTDDRVTEKITSALNQFVNRSVLRPNAAHRAGWMSDPRFMLISHLKGFMYSFNEVILRGAYNEAKNRKGEGILSQAAVPAMALATLLPMALAGLALRDLLQYALWGEESQRDVTDVFELLQRSGGLGYGQLAVDVYEAESRGRMSILALGGPTVSHLEAFLSSRKGEDYSEGAIRKLTEATPLVASLPGLRKAIQDVVR